MKKQKSNPKAKSVEPSNYVTKNNKQSHVGAAPASAQNAITLVALVVTIVVLLILAGVTINLTLGNNGIFNAAQKAAKNYTEAQNKEPASLNEFNQNLEDITDFDNINQFDTTKKIGVNKPKLMTGMTPIKFTDPTDTVEGTVEKTTVEDVNWYNYEAKQWANAQTEDGSMWVWIPRYAYRINSDTQTCDIKFLIGTTDQYYDENGDIQTAKRQTKAEETIDASIGYTVHPAFTDESKINFANGGWDKELTGIWVAKFEAGYAGKVGNNGASQVDSTVKYSVTTDNIYGVAETVIKYPTFQGTTCSMNYININDAFNISRALTGEKNIYGFNASQTDSHLMKNSEWGAISYLGQSQYGLNGSNIYINNVNLNDSTPKANAVTGCCGKTDNVETLITTIENINNGTADCYVWNEHAGQKASCTGTIYGIYDMSGGTRERTTGFIANENSYLKTHGASVAYEGNTLRTKSTKYVTVYPHDANVDKTGADINTASRANYAKNDKIYGDAIRETSNATAGANSWYGDYSYYLATTSPFSDRGDGWKDGEKAGLFCFDRLNGSGSLEISFRSVLVAL